ncbi:MAG: hypothetical protein OQJ89_04815, partial [Kangiellaceae bacterium]|nr:hypothetical protein [Kangiellaceae bacterium]
MRDNEDIIYKTGFFTVEAVEGEQRKVSKVDYLEMLNYVLEGNSIRQLKELLPTMESPIEDICLLLSVKNWRPHLLACGAAVLIDRSPKIIDALWDRFDRTSWVCPQIAATLSIVDENFCQNTFERLAKGALIKDPDEYQVKLYKSDTIE